MSVMFGTDARRHAAVPNPYAKAGYGLAGFPGVQFPTGVNTKAGVGIAGFPGRSQIIPKLKAGYGIAGAPGLHPPWVTIVNTDFTGTATALPAPWQKYGDFATNYNSMNPASYYLQANAFIEPVDVDTNGNPISACVLRFQYQASGPARNGNYNGAPVNVSGVANNGSGLIRITTSVASKFSTGSLIAIAGVTGTTEANGSWRIDVIGDPTVSTQFTLRGSTFTNGYTGGGTATTTPYPGDALGAGWYGATITAAASRGFPTNVSDHRTTYRMRVLHNTINGCHRNLPLYWGVTNDNYWVNGEEDYFEIDPAWGAPDGAGKELTRAFWHYSPTKSPPPAPWLFVDEGAAYQRIYLPIWHTYRIQKLNKQISWFMDDLTTPLWSVQYGAGDGTNASNPLVTSGKRPVFQQEQPNNSDAPTGRVGFERIEIDYVTIEVPG